MKINTDHYYTGKNRHKPCEDYAASGMNPVPFVVVADGCSSSPGSHMGAMLICLAANKHIKKIFTNNNLLCEPDYKEFGKSIISRAFFFIKISESA